MRKGDKRGPDHGLSNTREHNAWRAMKKRCLNPSHAKWKDYGGRGIKVCDRWRDDFLAFVGDMGFCPPGLTLERDNNDGDYEPSNCRWATMKDQSNNRRRAKISTRNRSGVKGVCWVATKAVFEVTLSVNGRPQLLGRTPDFLEACCLRKSAENRHFNGMKL